MMHKKVVFPLAVLIAFICLLIFISTSIEMTNTLAGEVETVTIGLGSPWYQQVSGPTANSRQMNLLAPSFLSGLAGLLIIWASLHYYRRQ